MRYLVTGGGTGGHIYPALAIIMEIKKRDANAEILYVGTKKGMESEIVPREGIDFKAIRVNYLPRNFSKDSFIALKELIHGIFDSKKILKEYKPDIVIATGGYVCGPMGIASARKKIPTIVHESNVLPGITNKILSKFVDKVLITYEEARKYLKKQDNIILTGNPIRSSIFEIDKEEAFKEFELEKDKKIILSFGGSGGQKKLNESMFDFIKNNRNIDLQIIHVTGKKFYEEFIEKLAKEEIILPNNIKIMPYIYNMPTLLNIIDLIITSSGAITLAEISALGIPSILIPKGYSAENHQEYNARAFSDKGASELILEKDLTGELLSKTILDIIYNDEKLNIMSEESKKLGNKDAAKEIVDIINELIK